MKFIKYNKQPLSTCQGAHHPNCKIIWTSVLSFFSSLVPLPGVFSFHLNIYLFIYLFVKLKTYVNYLVRCERGDGAIGFQCMGTQLQHDLGGTFPMNTCLSIPSLKHTTSRSKNILIFIANIVCKITMDNGCFIAFLDLGNN